MSDDYGGTPRVLICAGGRDYYDKPMVYAALDRIFPEFVYVGCATGVDQDVRNWCWVRKVDHATLFARWGEEGKAAGPNRNARLAEESLLWWSVRDADVRLLYFPGKVGTRNMIRQAAERDIELLDARHVVDPNYTMPPPWEGRRYAHRVNPHWA